MFGTDPAGQFRARYFDCASGLLDAVFDERQFDAEQEIRVLTTRRARLAEKRGLFDRFRKK